MIFFARCIEFPFSVVHSDISCQYNGADVIYPIAFRTHTHELGKRHVISVYCRPMANNRIRLNKVYN